jgi:hypothetical protein
MNFGRSKDKAIAYLYAAQMYMHRLPFSIDNLVSSKLDLVSEKFFSVVCSFSIFLETKSAKSGS